MTPAQSLNDRTLRASVFDISGVALLADPSGALFWEEQSLLVVSDLHLEKGSSYAGSAGRFDVFFIPVRLGADVSLIARRGNGAGAAIAAPVFFNTTIDSAASAAPRSLTRAVRRRSARRP